LILTGSGCTTTVTRYVTTPLPLPDRPALPPVSNDDLQCLSPAAYERLLMRQRLRRDYTEELETIIKGTHRDG
tara:strand:- start:729 stop:947 length:219 start_codon:yes stop_codon:yes gene_type:complete